MHSYYNTLKIQFSGRNWRTWKKKGTKEKSQRSMTYNQEKQSMAMASECEVGFNKNVKLAFKYVKRIKRLCTQQIKNPNKEQIKKEEPNRNLYLKSTVIKINSLDSLNRLEVAEKMWRWKKIFSPKKGEKKNVKKVNRASETFGTMSSISTYM